MISPNFPPVLVIMSGNSPAFPRKILTGTDFTGAATPVVVKNESPNEEILMQDALVLAGTADEAKTDAYLIDNVAFDRRSD